MNDNCNLHGQDLKSKGCIVLEIHDDPFSFEFQLLSLNDLDVENTVGCEWHLFS
jgi:hypothetical protein